MIVLNTQYNVLYPRLSDIRRRVVEYEDILSSEFLPYEILPIPDNAPSDIPRVTITTKHGHSMLQMSLTGAAFQTAYDDEFNKCWNTCHDYLTKRTTQVFDIISYISSEQIHMQGFTAQIILDNLEGDPVNFLHKNISVIDGQNQLWDLGCHATIVKDNKYFVSVQISNARIADAPLSPFTASVHDSDYKNHLLIAIEVTNRKLFNKNHDYNSPREAAAELLALLSDIVTNQLNDFLETGVFAL